MARTIILSLLAVVLPFAAYLFWLRFERWRERLPPEKRPVPWVPLLAVGIVLALVVVFGEALLGGAPAGGRYVPARIENGQLVPGQFEAPVK
ncbi:DUF6111 family protein [Zavarzinia compransoris]|uniref:Uncharacterized protein n=1 Tax=Zavarzinia compransoris TaxID=1264899 RepID=A0A317EDJ1_9PROT|nr:DUF6111 family protein [Zavarzinia compransoris]PWR23285.1 hypothetical protein DKG75_01570 [Zavarzinia compransoris]TDP46146.1 hypothetical protein DES42_104232 [Zavarzinia compransoris]